jgi:hypothetical protein
MYFDYNVCHNNFYILCYLGPVKNIFSNLLSTPPYFLWISGITLLGSSRVFPGSPVSLPGLLVTLVDSLVFSLDLPVSPLSIPEYPMNFSAFSILDLFNPVFFCRFLLFLFFYYLKQFKFSIVFPIPRNFFFTFY